MNHILHLINLEITKEPGYGGIQISLINKGITIPALRGLIPIYQIYLGPYMIVSQNFNRLKALDSIKI